MSNLNLVIVFLLLASAALLTVSVINASQTRKRLINQRIITLKRKVSELTELATALEKLTGSTELEKVILDETVDILNGMLQLSPNSQAVELTLETTLERINEISVPGYSVQLFRLMESDAQIARAQYILGEAAIIVRKRQASGSIELVQMNSYIEELAWANLTVPIVSLTAQGHKAIRRGDVLRAYAFYKRAQQDAMASPLGDERRHQFIRELSELQSNSRKSLSVSLMPETMFNPELVETAAPKLDA